MIKWGLGGAMAGRFQHHSVLVIDYVQLYVHSELAITFHVALNDLRPNRGAVAENEHGKDVLTFEEVAAWIRRMCSADDPPLRCSKGVNTIEPAQRRRRKHGLTPQDKCCRRAYSKSDTLHIE